MRFIRPGYLDSVEISVRARSHICHLLNALPEGFPSLPQAFPTSFLVFRQLQRHFICCVGLSQRNENNQEVDDTVYESLKDDLIRLAGINAIGTMPINRLGAASVNMGLRLLVSLLANRSCGCRKLYGTLALLNPGAVTSEANKSNNLWESCN